VVTVSGVIAAGGVTGVIQNSPNSQMNLTGANAAYVNGYTVIAGTLGLGGLPHLVAPVPTSSRSALPPLQPRVRRCPV